MSAVDLGHGTTALPRSRGGVQASVWVGEDGRMMMIPTRRLRALALSLHHGNREAAYLMGIAESTLKIMLAKLNRQLGTFGKWEAACALGWVTCPPALLDASPEDFETAGGRSVAGLEKRRSAVVPSRNGAAA